MWPLKLTSITTRVALIALAFLACVCSVSAAEVDDDQRAWSGSTENGNTVSIYGHNGQKKMSQRAPIKPSSGKGTRSSSITSKVTGQASGFELNGDCPTDPRIATASLLLCVNGYAIFKGPDKTECSVLCISGPDPQSNSEYEPVDVTRLVTIEDVKRLVVSSGKVTVNPARGWAYINMPVYYSSNAAAHDVRMQVAGQEVTVHLTPISWTWIPGDGSASFQTDEPGKGWPNSTVSHTYSQPAQSVTVTVAVAWQASFTVAGLTYPVEGTATATSSASPFELVEAESVLTN